MQLIVSEKNCGVSTSDSQIVIARSNATKQTHTKANADKLRMLVVDKWTQQGIRHGFGGADLDIATSVNRWAEVFGQNNKPLLFKQIHSDVFVVINNLTGVENLLQNRPEGDAWIIDCVALKKHGGVFVGIKTADCIPVLIVHKDYFAAVHCGWRGAAIGVLVKVIEYLKGRGVDAKDIEVAIGPGAQVHNYEIGEDVAEEFASSYISFKKNNVGCSEGGIAEDEIVVKRAGKLYGNIPRLLMHQLAHCNVPFSNVVVSTTCTIEDKNYFSCRRQGDSAGRQITYIGI